VVAPAVSVNAHVGWVIMRDASGEVQTDEGRTPYWDPQA
jgi:hypothetical protein